MKRGVIGPPLVGVLCWLAAQAMGWLFTVWEASCSRVSTSSMLYRFLSSVRSRHSFTSQMILSVCPL
jgi:hypothetical protein